MPDKMIKADNKPAKHAGGRPAKFVNYDEFQLKIDGYFNSTTIIPTIEGLADYLDCDVETLRNYEGDRLPEGIREEDKQKFFRAIKRARRKCQASLVNHGLVTNNPAMNIFLLKNNYGYKDKTEVETTVNVINYADRLAGAEERRRLQERTIDAEIVRE